MGWLLLPPTPAIHRVAKTAYKGGVSDCRWAARMPCLLGPNRDNNWPSMHGAMPSIWAARKLDRAITVDERSDAFGSERAVDGTYCMASAEVFARLEGGCSDAMDRWAEP